MINNTAANFNSQKYYKYCQRRTLEKTSSGLGFFIFAYFATMYATSFILQFLLLISQDKIETVPMFYISIFISVFSAFLPGLFYFLISGRSITGTIQTNYVRQGTLWQIVFIGMAVSMIANYASNIIITNLSLFEIENQVNMFTSTSTFEERILYIISTAIVPAFAEEFAYRGILLGVLRKYGDAFAIITSSIIFGAMHGNITQIPFAFILGLILAYVDCKTNSILPSIIIHFVNNFYAVMLDILNSSGEFNDRKLYIFSYALIAAFCILGFISFLHLIKKDRHYFSLSDTFSQHNNEFCNLLTFKEKIKAFFFNPGIIFVLVLFSLETLGNTFPIQGLS